MATPTLQSQTAGSETQVVVCKIGEIVAVTMVTA